MLSVGTIRGRSNGVLSMTELGNVVSLQTLEQYRNSRALEFFNDRWNEISLTTMFGPEWDYPYGANGIPSIWPPISSPQLRSIPAGKIFRATHRSGQRMLIVGTRLGPVVVYTAKSKESETLMCRFAGEALAFSGFLAIPSINLDVKAVRHILGTGTSVRRTLQVPNLGEKIEALYRHFTNPERHSLGDLNQGHE
jgi:hypothetical protein